MNYVEYIENNAGKFNKEMSFALAQQCSKLILTGKKEDLDKARELIIRMLHQSEDIPEAYLDIWDDLIEAVGFYPYLKETRISQDCLSEQARFYYFKSEYLDKKILHTEQKKISERLFSGQNLVLSAPTSFGKSLLIEELVASNKYKNIVVIQPTLALLDETRIKLKKYARNYKIIVRTSQNISEDKRGNLFLLTAERVMEYENLPKIDLLIIDEFYKLSLRRTDGRSDILNNAFLKVLDTGNPQFYLLGPNINGITDGFTEKYKAEFYRTDFSMVASKVVDLSGEFDYGLSKKQLDRAKEKKLYELLDNLKEEQTIIYCASPARARKIAREYYRHVRVNTKENGYDLPLVEWIKDNVSPEWSLVDSLKYGIAIHDGSLQKHISCSIINYFNSKKIKYIFCTSTIIEGVNTNAKNVIIYDSKKGTVDIDFFDYSNICGRSGRLMEYYLGKIYSFVPKPPVNKFIVDIPFVEQDENVLTDEILINIPKEDVKPQLRERYKKLDEYPHELKKLLKKNGIKIDGQIKIYQALERDIHLKRELIIWSQQPSYEQLKYILSLSSDTVFKFDKHGVYSAEQLALLLMQYGKNKSIKTLVLNIKKFILSKRAKLPTEEDMQAINDRAIEEAFHVYRHWFQFNVPKALRVVDSLQKYVCGLNDIKSGSYSFFAQQLENDFIQDRLSILIEYGLPNTTITNLARFIPPELMEDEIVEYIKSHKDVLSENLSKYEIDIISEEL